MKRYKDYIIAKNISFKIVKNGYCNMKKVDKKIKILLSFLIRRANKISNLTLFKFRKIISQIMTKTIKRLSFFCKSLEKIQLSTQLSTQQFRLSLEILAWCIAFQSRRSKLKKCKMVKLISINLVSQALKELMRFIFIILSTMVRFNFIYLTKIQIKKIGQNWLKI